jgi:hypothetical protein
VVSRKELDTVVPGTETQELSKWRVLNTHFSVRTHFCPFSTADQTYDVPCGLP